jgi:hypothetical protein
VSIDGLPDKFGSLPDRDLERLKDYKAWLSDTFVTFAIRYVLFLSSFF